MTSSVSFVPPSYNILIIIFSSISFPLIYTSETNIHKMLLTKKKKKRNTHTIATVVGTGKLEIDITSITQSLLIHVYELFVTNPKLLPLEIYFKFISN